VSIAQCYVAVPLFDTGVALISVSWF